MNQGTPHQSYKARFMLQGHPDQEKKLLVRTSSTVRQYSFRVLVRLAAILGLKLWSQAIFQAYMRGAERISQDGFVGNAPQFHLPSFCLLEILRELYGLTEAGDYCHGPFKQNITGELEMKYTAPDLSLS